LRVDAWEESHLADVTRSKIVYGIVQAGNHVADGIPYIKSSDVGRAIDPASLSKTAPAIHRKYHRSTVGPGDIVFSLRGNTGSTSIVPADLMEANLTQGTARIAVKSSFDNRFVRYVLASDIAMRQVLAVAKGSTFTEVSLDALRKISIPHPPLPEQRKIADILSTWDRAIETTEALLATARLQKRALMQSLLTGNRRFPEFNGQPWQEMRLGDLGTFRKGKGLPKTTVGPVGRYPCVLYGELYTTYGEVISHPVSFTDQNDGFLGKAGDVLIPASTTTSGIDLAIASCVLSDGVRLGGDINIFRCNSGEIDGAYLAYFLTHARRHEMARFAQGITIVHLKGSDLLNISVAVPSSEEQIEIVMVMTDAEDLIARLGTEIKSLRAEKKALMQQLLTGKRRVVV